MTWNVFWNGLEYDADPAGFSGLELQEIKQRTGLDFWPLLKGIPRMDPDATRAVFWTVDRRQNPELAFGDYAGPTFRDLLPYLGAYKTLVDDLGKAVETATSEASEKPGIPSSPSGTDASTGASTTP